MTRPKQKKKAPPKRPAKVPVAKMEVVDSYRKGETDPMVLPTVKVEIIPAAGSDAHPDWLKQQCQFFYTSNLQRISLNDVAEHPGFKGRVVLRTLERWAQAGNWQELRRQNAENLRKLMVVEMGREVIESRRKMLRELEEIKGHVFQELLPNKKGKLKHDVNSYEGLGQLFSKLALTIDEVTSKVHDEVLADAPTTQTTGATDKTSIAIKPDLSVEEARAGAKAILKMRREAVEAEVAAANKDPVKKGP